MDVRAFCRLGVDIAIVGAGPAGLATALHMAQKGWRVVVVDKRHLPIDKACGEGIMPPGVAQLRTLGVEPYLDKTQVSAFAGISLHAGAHVAQGRFSSGVGWGIRRTALSSALWARLRGYPNVAILTGETLRAVQRSAAGIRCSVAGEQFMARLLVGADGLHSGVRRWAGLQAARAPLQRWGLRRHVRCSPWSDGVEVHLGDGLEAYVTPCGPEQVGVAFLWEKHRRPGNGADAWRVALRAFPALYDRLCDRPALSEARGAGPLHQLVRGPVAPGIALVGDASGYVDAITGEGISLALAQAEALGKSIATALRGHGLVVEGLAAYARAHARIVAHYKRFTPWALKLLTEPQRATRLVAALAAAPGMLDHVLAVNMGARPFFALPPGDFGRFVWALSRSRGPQRSPYTIPQTRSAPHSGVRSSLDECAKRRSV